MPVSAVVIPEQASSFMQSLLNKDMAKCAACSYCHEADGCKQVRGMYIACESCYTRETRAHADKLLLQQNKVMKAVVEGTGNAEMPYITENLISAALQLGGKIKGTTALTANGFDLNYTFKYNSYRAQGVFSYRRFGHSADIHLADNTFPVDTTTTLPVKKLAAAQFMCSVCKALLAVLVLHM